MAKMEQKKDSQIVTFNFQTDRPKMDKSKFVTDPVQTQKDSVKGNFCKAWIMDGGRKKTAVLVMPEFVSGISVVNDLVTKLPTGQWNLRYSDDWDPKHSKDCAEKNCSDCSKRTFNQWLNDARGFIETTVSAPGFDAKLPPPFKGKDGTVKPIFVKEVFSTKPPDFTTPALFIKTDPRLKIQPNNILTCNEKPLDKELYNRRNLIRLLTLQFLGFTLKRESSEISCKIWLKCLENVYVVPPQPVIDIKTLISAEELASYQDEPVKEDETPDPPAVTESRKRTFPVDAMDDEDD